MSWQVASKAAPADGRFIFKAPHDGEYWFCIRTVDRQGVMRPDAPQKPELRVLVDTLPPRLDFSATRGPAGEITARWQVVDPNLKLESLMIDYQTGTDQPWERVTVEAAPLHALHRHRRSHLHAQEHFGVGDRASPSALTAPATRPSARCRSPATARPPATATWPAATDSAGANGAADATAGTTWPADRTTDESLTHQRGQNAAAPSKTDSFLPGQPSARLASSSRNRSTSGESGASQSGAPDSGEPANSNKASSSSNGLCFDVLPPGEHPRMINSRRFELEYDVESVGPSGIAKVELWGTTDGGKTWKSFGLDNDNRSPLLVNVPGEGLYGFTIIFQNGNGFGGYPPREGDVPEIWVGVDLTPPSAKITGADIGRDAGELVVSWTAQDERLDPRPISLSFSEHPMGPWATIAAGLENTGQYAWRLDNRVPNHIFLRLEVRDESGNVGQYVSPEAVALNLQRPMGRIRGVRPTTPAYQGVRPQPIHRN